MDIRKITYGALFLALCVVFPMFFHLVGGPAAGKLFLPMHIPVLLSGFLAGPVIGAIVGVLGPLLSFFFTGMPAGPMLVSMPIELCLYGLLSGVFYYKLKYNVYISLLLSMICGRIVLAGMLGLLTGVLSVKTIGALGVFASITTSIPGIVLQLILVPITILGIKKLKGTQYETTVD